MADQKRDSFSNCERNSTRDNQNASAWKDKKQYNSLIKSKYILCMYKPDLLWEKSYNALLNDAFRCLDEIGVTRDLDLSIIEIGNFRSRTKQSDIDLTVFVDNDSRYKGIEATYNGITRLHIQIKSYGEIELLIKYPNSWESILSIYLLIEGRIIEDKTSKLRHYLKLLRAIYHSDDVYFGVIFNRLDRCQLAIKKFTKTKFEITNDLLRAYISHEVVVACLAMKRHVYPGPKRLEYLLTLEEFENLREYAFRINQLDDEPFAQYCLELLKHYDVIKLLESGKKSLVKFFNF